MSILGIGMENCRLEQVKRRRLLPSCSHMATSGAADLSQFSQAACTSSPEKGISVPNSSGRSLSKKAYSFEGVVPVNPFSIIVDFLSAQDYTASPCISIVL